MSEPIPFDAVVLAGGAAERLGGASKPDVELGGARLVDRVLVAVSDAREIVVVGDVDVPPGVHRTLEDPPLGGPVAGVAAGLDALAADGAADWTVLLACDLADPLPALGRLLAAWSYAQRSADVDTAEHDGWCLEDSTGHPQWLLGIHRTASLRRALERLGPPRDRSMKSLLGQSVLVTVPASDDDVADIDTWTDHARWVERLRDEEAP
ncbi:NTP transferase domain-containing protein [Janibacter terrae]|uniref:NTP transferase domain-containing protein n=1 Tax=Janibacter terrae TaxID=103817 RepID=A0ABZ2FB04_9MICO|nr:NTP transferase domain-containing protein [Janibacter terrae]MBA4085266.1 molybdopterin-guanine dinucleotide biosynthesis protein MobA [Kytococcus sp.]HBO53772.1 molybdopterin-guanine dinucleotide biosynthesis protein MobA [Janibacter terrae]